MKVSLNLCLLFSLISPVLLLTCQKCKFQRRTDCPRVTAEHCNSNESCRTSIYNSNVFVKVKKIQKSCSPSTSCVPGEYSLTTSKGGFLNILVDCCTTDKCNSKPLKFSSKPKEPNGLECEGCRFTSQGVCDGVEMVKCLGDQTKCISMDIAYVATAIGRGRFFITKGCATPLMCDQSKWKQDMDFIFIITTNITVNCTDPISSPNVSSLA